MEVEQKLTKMNTQLDNQLIPILDTALQKKNKRVKNANYDINQYNFTALLYMQSRPKVKLRNIYC